MSVRALLRLKLELRPSAACNAQGCEWSHHRSSRTRQAAKAHVRLAGHPVIIETKTVEEWGPA